ncbi:MAG: PRC-barrel domain-containing protein [Planctomycetes bacterium]|nr:PRC-barrel domain-containing protein [Planctomycetota bacterium]
MTTTRTDTPTVATLSVRELLHAKVKDLVGEPLGTIEDLAIDAATGRVTYAILGFGGLLGVGEKLFPVPWDHLHWRAGDQSFVLQHHGKTRDDLAHAPHVHRERWRVDLVDRSRAAEFHSFYSWGPRA